MTNFQGTSFTFLGRSGSGKGTQFDLLQKKLEDSQYTVLRHGSGDAFRSLAQHETIAGKKVKDILEKGGLMPAWLASYTWEKRLVEGLKEGESVIFLDGSPRRVDEAKRIDEVLLWLGRIPVVPVHIHVSAEEVMRRLLLRGRNDDTEESIENRLAWFDNDVQPIIDYYNEQGRVMMVDGVGSEEEVFNRVLAAIQEALEKK